ncbi:DoxX family protein [Snuella sedimenti]|uniref:DoxX family protein n=1 Tax=Snuella sedimenti TaxID=2798802 RepID=A0A8J7IVK2_9FLAO|nr:DoxX family protein [Snuella sedimenti]MBJ6367720.1 hypothetical protein [Snuella sedimenti]
MFSSRLFETPFKWLGKTVLDINYSYDVNGFGSGDNTYAYVTLVINVILAIIISIIWILLGNSRKNYNKLFYWFIVALRIFLISFMFSYGSVKIIQLQFPYPSLAKMLEPLGNFSPMGLAWTYLGYSKGYNLFMGLMEIIGGLLLIPRRTSTLGAFITMGVMTHVVIMNFTYDIPVKIFSIHLTLMALFIFSTDLKRFIKIFITNKPIRSYDYFNPIKNKTYHKIILWTKCILIIAFFSIFFVQSYGNNRGKSNTNKPPLYGVWEVTEYIKEGDTLQPLITDTERWRYLIIEQANHAIAKTMNDVNHSFKFKTDTINKKVMIYSPGTKSETYNFKYELLNNEILTLKGDLYLYNLEIKLRKKDLLLDSRDFHWINEKPFNR